MLRLLIIASTFSAAAAYLHAPSVLGVSRFAGARVEHYEPAAPVRRNFGVQRSVMEAKKGKGVPIQNRGNQVAQEKMQERMGQMKVPPRCVGLSEKGWYGAFGFLPRFKQRNLAP
jgi:hypothetical protein